MPRRVTESELLAALTEVFRTYGYEGATLARVSEATGLQKSSLYHRFPEGKAQMAQAVLESVYGKIVHEILAPLRGSGSPRARVKRTAERLSAFYAGGDKACLLDTMSLEAPPEAPLADLLRGAHDAVIDAFTAIGVEAGLSRATARRRATDAMVALQGALVVTRITGDAAVFERTMGGLPDLLTAASR